MLLEASGLTTVSSLFAWIVGEHAGSTYILTRWIFLRFLGIIYLIAFLSLWVQIKGLIGSQGILPAQEYLDAIRGQLGPERYRLIPTLLWFGASDAALYVVCGLGVFFSILVILNVVPTLSLILLWVLYLSLFSVGQDFLSFQWDTLLLEVGFLAVLFSPWNILPGIARETLVSPLALFLLWWLLFRFSVESGVVKLMSGDPTWRNLTALDYHYFTQPLPSWTSWYMQQLPEWFQRSSVILMYILEIGFPFLMFLGRIPRIISSLGMILLQLLIAATGNYNFFNLLTIALSLLLIPDQIWLKILPAGFLERIGPLAVQGAFPPPFLLLLPIATVILLVSGFQFMRTFWRFPLPSPVRIMENLVDPFHSINSYGLFRVMTTKRPEILVEGSDDGVAWIPYEFKWKPGNPKERPKFVEPHQPRLDWQMWFAALSRFQHTEWFQRFLVRLLQGSPDVLHLLAINPFPIKPPKYIRASLYNYHFTNFREKKETGSWWKREYLGLYAPVLSLQSILP